MLQAECKIELGEERNCHVQGMRTQEEETGVTLEANVLTDKEKIV